MMHDNEHNVAPFLELLDTKYRCVVLESKNYKQCLCIVKRNYEHE
jgi:hypothetical protein